MELRIENRYQNLKELTRDLYAVPADIADLKQPKKQKNLNKPQKKKSMFGRLISFLRDDTEPSTEIPGLRDVILEEHSICKELPILDKEKFRLVFYENFENIRIITFIRKDSMNLKNTYEKWDLSEKCDNSIEAVLDEDILYLVSKNGVRAPRDCSDLISASEQFPRNNDILEEIKFNGLLATGNVTDMSRMFWGVVV